MSTIYDWSLTALENAGADGFINWLEGQAPHTVNDSARCMMQRIREYLTDTGGVLEGILKFDDKQQTTAIMLETKSQFKEYKNGIVVWFKAKGKNVGATTVSLDSLSSKPVYKATEEGIFPLVGGEIQKGSIYSLVYDEEISGWQLLNPTMRKVHSFRRLPAGFIGAFAMELLPAGWLLCDGQAYSRLLYSDLFAAIGTMWGPGNGEKTFNVPDLRGMFLRGFDYFGFVDAGRSFSSMQQCSLREHEHGLVFPSATYISTRSRRASSSVKASSRRKRSVYVDYEVIGEDHVTETRNNLRGRTGRRRCFSSSLWGEDNADCFGDGQDALPSRSPSLQNEECVGLTGDALRKCNEAFEGISPPTGEETLSQTRKAYTTHPFFIEHDSAMRPYIFPKVFGEDLGEHDHTIMMGRFGGEETRPINVSVIYGIKT
ncbi:hypothetical protein ME7_00675 [Bartonella birtlesii LL-WM9]|uniref:Phage tail collar domain-containing protein n=1 Tax=Bartonella birtlesii LL-WM9 TaxID=1094552 RepID=J1J063_9HYPH|nr:phage tail protein [Bartonella birtlesii]EJF76925.1 hypothetical protein ME7_00675 [Bartonella birtlesii LL-WM9]